MKRILPLLLAVLLLLCGCGNAAAPETTVATTEEVTTAPPETEPPKKTRDQMRILLSLPDESDPYWQAAGDDLLMLLENLTYQVDLAYAGSDALNQAQYIQQALETGVDCIILAPVDSVTLTEVCDTAAQQGTVLIAYDRMVTDSEHIGYYVAYDYRAMGVAMGNHIVEKAALDTAEKPLTIEFFMGTPEDNKALLLYLGVMEVLQPYLEEGKLIANSGRTAFEDTCIHGEDAATVEEIFRQYLQEHYRRSCPDIICTVSDDFADVCIRVLEEKKLKLPLITGIGGTEAGLANTACGKQSFTVTMDMEQLNERCVTLTDDLLSGKEPEVNDTESCHNNAVTVPAYLCPYEVVLPEEVETSEATTPTA